MTEFQDPASPIADAGIFDRPIVVGYAFGPKKMSTMGVVMAEASKTKITASIYNPHVSSPATIMRRANSTNTFDQNHGSQRTIISPELDEDDEEFRVLHLSLEEDDPDRLVGRATDSAMISDSGHFTSNRFQNSQSHVVFSIDGYGTRGGADGCGLANIVRHFQSSCSDSESTGTCTASTNTNADSRTATSSLPATLHTITSGGSATSLPQHHHSMIRVSFVPLDPDQPLQDQHGGKIDIILHKLTEDILCLSQLSLQSQVDTDKERILSPTEHAAIRRVQRLSEFRDEQPHCCLVDDPDRVQIVMSRSDIASKLHECLQNVTTASGMPVSAPKYAVVTRPANDAGESDCTRQIACQLENLSFPIIVKPLIAAGTKASHAMAVLLDPSGLDKVATKAPCLCQEFSNHDTLLYKVYVLGEYVSVHKRRSLPNLPRDCQSRFDYVEFDSHRPYPRLSDFGYDELEVTNKKRPRSLQSAVGLPHAMAVVPTAVTASEVMPVVEALKQAFGLELFGFDVLITSDQRTMLVVDVNYFPSYKEVPDFPSLLAKYLADRAIKSRKLALEDKYHLSDDESRVAVGS